MSLKEDNQNKSNNNNMMMMNISNNQINGEEHEHSDDEDINKLKKTIKHDSGVADLEKVTDYAEEKEVSSQDIMGALTLIRDRQDKAIAAKIEREKELLRVHISKDDVDLIVNEMEISRNIAERTLRKHNGDVVAALTALTD